MNHKRNIKFLWISPFGPLVTIRIKEISHNLLEKGITPIILTHKLKKKEHSNKTGDLYYLHFQNPLFYNFKSKSLKYVRELVVKVAFLLGGLPFLFSDVKHFLKKNKGIDFIFIDGHHDKKATLSYFRQILPYLSDGAILVFDDIYWSSGMEKAWNTIRKDPNLKISVDFLNIGICIFTKAKAL